jgi:hypothetical protein
MRALAAAPSITNAPNAMQADGGWLDLHLPRLFTTLATAFVMPVAITAIRQTTAARAADTPATRLPF